MPQLLTIEHLSKTFPGQVALHDVSLTLGAGRTHALVGQNGSGKSTLIKILAGYHEPDPGASATMGDVSARPLELGSSRAATEAGIRFVHQDLGLVDAISSVENLALGFGYRTGFAGHINWRAEREQAQVALADLGFTDIDVRVPVGMLAPSQKTAVAIARALQGWEDGAELLVLDEPTASLPGEDVERLFEAVRRLKANGVAILYVSHHLDEVFAIADEVTILRDGRRITTTPVEELDHERLVELIVGHKVEAGEAARATTTDRVPALMVRDLVGNNVRKMSFQVGGHEAVGIAGLTGSGREDVIGLITGQWPRAGGTVVADGWKLPNYAPGQALDSGVAFVPADRMTQGMVPLMRVRENLTLCSLDAHWRLGLLHMGAEVTETQEWIERLDIKTPSPETPIGALSGGNQQKVLFGKGLRLAPRILLLDEPTRGIDVGAKEEIHLLIDHAVADGAAVLVASTDTEELVRLCHRVLIMNDGRVAQVLEGDDIDDERIEHAQLQTAGGTAE